MIYSRKFWIPFFITVILIIGIAVWFIPDYTLKKLFFNSQYTLSIFGYTISLFDIIKTIFNTAIVLLIAKIILSQLSKWIEKSHINPNIKGLTIKTIRILLYIFVGWVLLSSLGVPMTSLAVISSAIGVGIGFGLQKITSNFISGYILAIEGSIKEGDILEMENNTWVTVGKINGRYTILKGYDGKELMVPNEQFITSTFTNWTHSNKRMRITLNVGVNYGADLNLVKKLLEESATNNSTISKFPAPIAVARKFGDNSIDFILLFWIDNIFNGTFTPTHEVMNAITIAFKENNIIIPFPQRDVHIFDTEK